MGVGVVVVVVVVEAEAVKFQLRTPLSPGGRCSLAIGPKLTPERVGAGLLGKFLFSEACLNYNV